MLRYHKPLAIVDIETTGISPLKDRVIEVGVVRIEEGKITKKYTSFVNPLMRIPPEITQITGISESHISRAPLFEEIANELREHLDGAIFVAHNARFDYAFLKNEFKRLTIPFTSTTLDSVQVSRRLFPEFRTHNLSAIISRFGIKIENRHRALDDALAVYEFFEKIAGSRHEALFYDLIDQFTSRRLIQALPEGADLPELPGVYIFYNKDRDVLYVGKSTNIKKRVLDHFYSDSGIRKELSITSQVDLIETRVTAGELSALLLESDLIKEYAPIYNRQLRRNQSLLTLIETQNDDGFYTCTLIDKSEDIFDQSILATFKSKKAAHEYLYNTAKEYQLCPKLLGIENGRGRCFHSQLGQCSGVCYGKETCNTYNERHIKAFEKSRPKKWPYEGKILLREKGDLEDFAFVIDNWKFLFAFKYSADGEICSAKTPLSTQDSYKILARMLKKKIARMSIEQLDDKTFENLVNQSNW